MNKSEAPVKININIIILSNYFFLIFVFLLQKGIKPSDIKAEILQIEQENNQLKAKIQKLKKEKDALDDDAYFNDILKARIL